MVLIIVCVIVVAAVCAVYFLHSWNPQDEGTIGSTEGTIQPEANAADPVSSETGERISATDAAEEISRSFVSAYGSLEFPEKYVGNLEYREETEGETTMCIFTMVTERFSFELFRVCYGNEQMGKLIGYLNVDGADIPVTLNVCEYGDEAMTDETVQNIYYGMMDGLNVTLASIRNDSRFRTAGNSALVAEEKHLTYWDVELPSEMEWEESETESQYKITFYGHVNGEKIKLYSVALGDDTLKSVLGTYIADGTAKKVSVESYEIPEVDGWAESSVTELYEMMDTINDVIQVIMSSGNFSAELPEG